MQRVKFRFVGFELQARLSELFTCFGATDSCLQLSFAGSFFTGETLVHQSRISAENAQQNLSLFTFGHFEGFAQAALLDQNLDRAMDLLAESMRELFTLLWTARNIGGQI